jgi:hypothetical protein
MCDDHVMACIEAVSQNALKCVVDISHFLTAVLSIPVKGVYGLCKDFVWAGGEAVV